MTAVRRDGDGSEPSCAATSPTMLPMSTTLDFCCIQMRGMAHLCLVLQTVIRLLWDHRRSQVGKGHRVKPLVSCWATLLAWENGSADLSAKNNTHSNMVQRITHTAVSATQKKPPILKELFLKYPEVPETEGSTSRMLQAVYGWGQSPPAH